MIRCSTIVLTFTLLLLASTGPAIAHQPSPSSNAMGTIGGASIAIQYSAPSVRGRQIFGAGNLLSKDPTYPIWRAGANAATTMRTSADLDFGGLRVPRGTYTLYVNVRDPNAWELVISKQNGQWGLDYDAKQDLGRVKMTMTKPAALVETLRYEVRDSGGGKGELRLAWENHAAAVPITAAR
jgi:hypothetical protein